MGLHIANCQTAEGLSLRQFYFACQNKIATVKEANNDKKNQALLSITMLMLTTLACGVVSNPAATPTPTSIGGYRLSTPTSGPNTCDGIGGEFEMQILVGPAEAVGLEPVAVGGIPFSVVHQGESYLISGSGDIYYESVLQEAWGTYTVNMEMVAVVSGECIGTNGNSSLIVTIKASGTQMVEVRTVGFQGDFPWEGTNQLNLTFPLEEGATAEGEGWVFVLHLNQ